MMRSLSTGQRTVKDALWELEGGYCLWVGAGVTRQVVAGHADVPLWAQLTEEMEATAGVDAPVDEDFPTRLDRCAARLGHKRFQSRLRERYYTQVAESLLSQALELVEAEDFVPEPIRSLAALGQCANPIVSFNIEPISSLLLGRP